MTDIKIEKRLQFDYKLAIETEIINCKGKIKEYEDKIREEEYGINNFKERIKEYEKIIREDKERIEMYKGRLSGLQSANYFFDEYKKDRNEVDNEKKNDKSVV